MQNSLWLSVLSLYLDSGSQNCNYLSPLLLFNQGQQIAQYRSTHLYYHCWFYSLEQRCSHRILLRYHSNEFYTLELPRVQQVCPRTRSLAALRYNH